MKTAIRKDRDRLKGLFDNTVASDLKGVSLSLDEALVKSINITFAYFSNKINQ